MSQFQDNVAWQPQAGSQEDFLLCPVFEAIYSGTRGPGKTDALLMDFAQHVGQGYGVEWQGILFRTQFKDLKDVILKSIKFFPLIFPGARFNGSKSEWRFPDGESLAFRHIKNEADYQAYHGHAYPWIGFEELSNWADDTAYRLMMSCCRSTVPGIPRKYRATTNPYGRGHNWIKKRFNLPHGAHKVIRNLGEPERVAILGYISENKILLAADPYYIDRIRMAARNPSEKKAWLYGSWDITAGGMFDDVWNLHDHVLPFFVPPTSWRLDRSFDWGSARPFSVGWWAESDGSDVVLPNDRLFHTIKGDLIRLTEWYGWTGKEDEGLGLTNDEIALGILSREADLFPGRKVYPGPADTQIFGDANGFDRSISKDMAGLGVRWTRADKGSGSRKQGWERIRLLLRQAAPRDRNGMRLPRERPGIFVTDACDQFLRIMPSISRSDRDLDDIDSTIEDHIADETRYRCYTSRGEVAQKAVRGH